jgi:peptidoglycan/LPS O-acetylase OafA/YrhL
MLPRECSIMYRPDIDGLRAVAVLGVVLYHVEPGLVPGGFIGVDVFFVISGFLITSIIDQQQRNGSFSLVRFFERRLRRIAPALLTVVLAAILFAAWWFPPHACVDLGRSVMFTVLSSANYFFLQAADDYFHSPVESLPLLHTWSLSVEEQFYLVFPLLLMAIHRLFSRPSVRVASLSALAAASFAAAVWRLPTDPGACFYLLPFRGWELLLGSVLALHLANRAESEPTLRRNSGWMGILGLALIGTALFAFDRNTPFPGLAVLLPCAGAALVIWGGAGTGAAARGPAARLLASRPLVAIGLISYSVYLWHWPLIVFSRELAPRIPAWGAWVTGISFVAGFLSWRWIERPFLHRGSIATRWVVLIWLAVSSLLLGYARYIRKQDGFLLPPGEQITRILSFNQSLNPYQKLAFDKSVPPDRPFVYGATNVVTHYALWGDSHANAIASVMGDVARTNGQAFKFYGRGGTKPVLGVYSVKSGRPDRRQSDYTTVAFTNLLADTNITTVVLCARWITVLKGEALASKETPVIWTPFAERSPVRVREYFRDRLHDTLRQLQAAGKQVVLLYPTPELGVNVPQAVAAEVLRPEKLLQLPDARDFFTRQEPILQLFDELPPVPGVIRVRPYRFFLQDGKVAYRDGLVPLYQDDHHLNLVGASRLIPLFQRLFDGTLRDEPSEQSVSRPR